MTRTTRRVLLLPAFLAFLVLWRSEPANAQLGPSVVEIVNGREAAAREVIVKFRNQPQAATLGEIRSLAGADLVQRLGRGDLRRIRSTGLGVSALLQQLAAHPEIEYVEPNYVVHALTTPTDPSFPQLWGLKNVGQAVNGTLPGTSGADIHATQAWDVSTGSTANVVAVVDTGVDYTHPDLAANIWSAPSAFTVNIAGTSITCPAGSHGFNAISLTCDPMDDHNHGTHVSGTIGASGNNGIGVVGVNWVTQIMGIKFLDSTGSGTTADAINGIDFAIQAKHAFAATSGANVRVLSNSWGDLDFSQALLDEILAANDEDMLFVAAAGNYGISNDLLPLYPASYDAPNIISVAATTNTDELAFFSNYSPTLVHLGAPGVDIYSTTIGNTYWYFSGTSMATPHVSGAAALVLSQCPMDTAALKDTIVNTSEPVPGLAGMTVTGGRLDVNSAIRSCIAPPSAPTGLTALAGDGSVTLAWQGAIGALTFDVKRSLTPGGPYSVIAPGIKTKTYVNSGLANGTPYYYVVSASNTLGTSADSNEASATPKAPSDLVVSALTVPSAGGSGLTAVVTDTTRNQGPGASIATTTRFYLSRNGLIDANATLLNQAHDVPALASGAASTANVTVTIPSGLAVGIYFIVAKADTDNLEIETSESNNTLLRAITLGPDLIVTSLTAPSTAGAGGTIVVSDSVKNQGGDAAGAATTRFFLSTNGTIDGGDVQLTPGRAVSGLTAGASSTGSTTLLIPSNTATGSYYLIAKADGDGTVAESQESNNISLRILQVGGDLTVSALTVPSSIGGGTTITVTDTTANSGSGTVAASITRFFLSKNILLDGTATPLAGGRAVPDLAAGASSTGSTALAIPSSLTAGSYYLIAKADGDGAVAETQESNNALSRAVGLGGDLLVSALTVPATGGAGSTIVVSDTIANQGAGDAASSVTRFYLSANAVLDASDTQLPGSRVVPALAAGSSSTGSTTVTIPSTVVAGNYFLFAKADDDNAVPEAQEGNNGTSRSIRIGGDLVVSALTVPAKGAAGATLVVTDTTMNSGSGAAGGASVTRFYLSTNSLLDAADTLLTGGRPVADLAAGASSTGSASVTLPSPLAVGSYYIIAKADGDNAVPESQEGNNTLAKPTAVGPDLVVSSFTVPFTNAAGSTVSMTQIVLNQGADAAGASTIRFYLSANPFFDSSDPVLPGSRSVPALAAGASSSATTSVTIPAGTAPGFYTLFALADADAEVAESQEGNNTGVKTIQVVAGP